MYVRNIAKYVARLQCMILTIQKGLRSTSCWQIQKTREFLNNRVISRQKLRILRLWFMRFKVSTQVSTAYFTTTSLSRHRLASLKSHGHLESFGLAFKGCFSIPIAERPKLNLSSVSTTSTYVTCTYANELIGKVDLLRCAFALVYEG